MNIYIVETEDSLPALIENVNIMIEHGYEPQGGIIHTEVEDDNAAKTRSSMYSQAMVLPKDTQERLESNDPDKNKDADNKLRFSTDMISGARTCITTDGIRFFSHTEALTRQIWIDKDEGKVQRIMKAREKITLSYNERKRCNLYFATDGIHFNSEDAAIAHQVELDKGEG